jgi:hypothetical protein
VAAGSLLNGWLSLPGTMNGVFVSAEDISLPVTRIRALAAHSGPRFTVGHAFDVNPVTWQVLLHNGITVRGRAPAELGLDPEPGQLRAWNLDQLRGHWRGYADAALAGAVPRKPLVPGHRLVLARLLGPPRLHHTIATGAVLTKEAAGAYARDTFSPAWHPVLDAALALRAGAPVTLPPADALRLAGGFMLDVITDAERMSAAR